MAEDNTLARPYAEAIFDVAQAEGKLAEWSAALEAAGLVAADEALIDEIENPKFDDAELLTLLQSIFAGMPEAGPFAAKQGEGANFLRLLIENGRVAVLPEISTAFEALKAEVENVVDVSITSATAMNEAEQKQIADALTARLGRDINMTTAVDADLIGGAIIRAGDFVIDGSVRSQLSKLATTLSK
jgi:F-type H+-transporting ATPase subunit delta